MLRKQNYKRTFWAKGSFKLESGNRFNNIHYCFDSIRRIYK